MNPNSNGNHHHDAANQNSGDNVDLEDAFDDGDPEVKKEPASDNTQVENVNNVYNY